MSFKLLTKVDANRKLQKSNQKHKRYLVTGLHLAPAFMSGYNVCPNASPYCISCCLNFTGHGRYNRTQIARIRKTQLFFENRAEFKRQLYSDIHAFLRMCKRRRKKPSLRLNLTSDIAWEVEFPELFTDFPQIQFYDYTKNADRCLTSYKLPPNYYLIFSQSEVNRKNVRRVLRSGRSNVAVVFHNIPLTYKGKPVCIGDDSDLRFLDPKGVIVGLTPKGRRAKRDKSGFVI